MKRDPEVRALVVNGYVKLAGLLVGLAVLTVPVVLHPGVEGVRITQTICGIIGVALALWKGWKREWAPAFCLVVVLFSLATIALAVVVTDRSASGQVAKQLLIVVVVVAITIVLPRTAMHGGKRR